MRVEISEEANKVEGPAQNIQKDEVRRAVRRMHEKMKTQLDHPWE